MARLPASTAPYEEALGSDHDCIQNHATRGWSTSPLFLTIHNMNFLLYPGRSVLFNVTSIHFNSCGTSVVLFFGPTVTVFLCGVLAVDLGFLFNFPVDYNAYVLSSPNRADLLYRSLPLLLPGTTKSPSSCNLHSCGTWSGCIGKQCGIPLNHAHG